MGIISITVPVAGQDIDAGPVAAALTTIVNAINGALDNNNVNAAAAIDYSKINVPAGAITQAKITFDAWQAWVPVLTGSTGNPTMGATVIAGRYVQVGKTVMGWAQFVLGAGFIAGTGSIRCSLPVAAAGATALRVGAGSFVDVSATSVYMLTTELFSSTAVDIRHNNVGSSFTWTYTLPVVPANTDQIQLQFAYEAA